MAERTNLITSDNQIKYALGSVFLLIISSLGIIWLTKSDNRTVVTEKNLEEVIPVELTSEVLRAKEGEFCGAGTSGIIPCESGLVCNESKNVTDENGIQKTVIGAGGICIKTTTDVITKTATGSASTTVAPTLKFMENFESLEDGFLVKYDSKRKLLVENEESGKRYVFHNSLGNITVHVGKTWSWVSSGRIFTEGLLVDGVKSFVYEISNQKIVDVEKNDKKYTIQCVHNTQEILKTECEKFLEDFKFI